MSDPRARLTLRVALVLSAAIALNVLYLAPAAWVRSASRLVQVNGETALLVLIVGLLPTRVVGWTGSWRTRALAGGWTALWVYEVTRQAGHAAMGEQPLLYDLSALLRHLFILGRDLLGAQVYGVLAGAVALTAVLWATSTFLLARLESAARDRHLRWAWTIVLVFMLAGQDGIAGFRTRWTSPHLAVNLQSSWALWAELQRGVSSEAYDPLATIRLQRKPDVRIYAIESYGRVLAHQAQTRGAWGEHLAGMEARLTAAGWHAASAWGTAPVSGGRSWIADGTFLLGMHIAHQSSYAHVMAQIDHLHHLPGWMAAQGYETVLVRPKDRERPGVKLDNSFRFDHVVFHDELGYDGPSHGWGIIPDQFTVGFVQDEVLARLTAPRFAFLHLVTSHVPWEEPPPRLDDWRALEHLPGRRSAKYVDRTLEDQLGLELGRFAREGKDRSAKPVDDERLDAYWRLVAYDLDVIADALHDLPAEPTLILVMGDHQPPLVGVSDPTFDVPMHLLANDPSLLAEFVDQGFTRGLIPPDEPAAMAHEGFFSLLVRALARFDGQDPPRWYPEGSGGPAR